MRSTNRTREVEYRTRRALSLKERVKVIRLAENEPDTKKLASIFGCGRTQIVTILKNKDRLLEEFVRNGHRNKQRKPPFGRAIGRVVAEWVHRVRAAQIPITGCMIIDRGCQARKLFKYSDFRPNKRWLRSFTRRMLYGVKLKDVDPKLKTEKPQSLKLSDIYNDMKATLDPAVVEAMTKREQSFDYKMFLMAEKTGVENTSDSLKDETASSGNEKSEAEDYDDSTYQMHNSCEIDIKEEILDISDDNSDHKMDQTTSSKNEETEVDHPTCQLESHCEIEIKEEVVGDAIKTDEQALKCIRRLEEYSMLKNNYRAIGLIIQLEKLYKGEIEE